MKTLYLHIGTPKTGTSALQHFCAHNRRVLQEKGISYPDLGFRFPGIGKNRNAHFLSYREYLEKKKRDYEAEKQIRAEGLQKLDAEFENYDTVLLSDEHIWNEPEMDTKAVSELVQHFAAIGVTVKIIVYLRRQDQVIQSYWAQKLKETYTLTFEKYMEKDKYKFFRLDYATRLQEFVDALGKDNVIVRCYEKQQYQGKQQNIISDFLQIFGLDITHEYKDVDRVRNTSLEGPYLEVKRLLNTLPEFKTKRNYVVDLLKEQQEIDFENSDRERKKLYFTPEAEKEFMQAFAQENTTVAREYFGRSEGPLFFDNYMEELEKGNAGNSYTSKELVQICGNMLTRLEGRYEEVLTEKKKLERGHHLRHFAQRCKRKICSRV
ncbi:MAG: hypothetical protein Q4D32_08700 [Eubacteriales bacterium]|nr:hypothetical protein [Eubacteriales bacterium]